MKLIEMLSDLNRTRSCRALAQTLSDNAVALDCRSVVVFGLSADGGHFVEVSANLPTPGVPPSLRSWTRLRDTSTVFAGAGLWDGWTGFTLEIAGEVIGLVAGHHANEQGALSDLVGDIAQTFGRVTETDELVWRAKGLEAVVAHVKQGIIGVTLDGELLLYNSSLRGMVGWTQEDVRTQGWTNLVYETAEARQAAVASIAALVLGKASQGTVRRMRCKTGDAIELAIWSAVVPRPGKTPLLLGVMEDVTATQAANKQLHREVQLLRLGKLAGTIAHDFNNILCGVMGHAELLKYAHSKPGAIERHTQVIMDSAQRGAGLTRQLLAFGGAANLQLAVLVPGQELERVAQFMTANLPKGIDLHQEITPGLPCLIADAGQLQQVLINLVRNAEDALSGVGNITLGAAQMALPEDTQFRSDGCPDLGALMVCIRVSDDGPGFDGESLRRLFEPFYSTKPLGHGIGLAALRGIVDAHKGAVRVSNQDGGACVELFFSPSARPEQALPTLTEHAHGAGQRVWLSDEDGHVREFGEVGLARHGYRVQTFGSVESVVQALEKCTVADRPALLVLDAMGPSRGSELLSELRHKISDIRILWTSGYGMPEDDWPGTQQKFLRKPFTGDALAAAVARSLGPGV